MTNVNKCANNILKQKNTTSWTINLENGEIPAGIVTYFAEAQLFESIASFKNPSCTVQNGYTAGKIPESVW